MPTVASGIRLLRITTDDDELLAGLARRPKRLPSRLLYDARGAELFQHITRLDAYYPTRLELDLLERHLPDIAREVGPHARVIEPGSGEGRKPRLLLRALEHPALYVPIDLADEQLRRWAHAVRTELEIAVQPVVADYVRPFELPSAPHPFRRTLVFFPGSTIGNFEPGEARTFLTRLGRLAGDDRLLLLGADATRDRDALLRAYDDEHGVTAAFDLNVLAHVNAAHDATFDLDKFTHRAVWNADASRVEMHLVSARAQRVWVAGHPIDLAAGEPIVTEHCYKHTPAALQAILHAAGWRPREVFVSAERPYRLWLCEPC